MLSKRKAAMKTAMGMASGTSPAARPSPVKRVVPKRSTLGRRGAAAAPPVAANSSEVPASPRPAAEPSKRRRGVQVPYHDSVRGEPMPLPGADAASDAEVSFADLSETRSGLESQMEAVVKVFCVHSEPNFSLPWQRKRQFSSSGSGFVISGRRILTNAHCVDHHTQVRVKRRGSDAKLVARVLAVGPECDVALLTVDDDAFWEGLEPVRLGPLPRLQDAVAVVGYPIGGDTMSVTSGVVSRIEVTSYVHGAAELLGVQVDAAINSGNSGGPAFGPGGECVGIAFQSLKHEDAENISYIIPTPVVEHFIRDYETHGAYTGFPSLGIEWQKMESPVMRRALGMAPDERGVLVRRVEPTSPLAPLLGQGDVLLSFDGVAIGSDGTVPFRFGERIGFNYLVSQKYTGDSAQLGVRRARRDGDSAKQSVGVSCVRQLPVPKVPKVSARGTSKTAASQPHASEVCLFELQLQAFSRLIPVHIDNRPPSYFIYGGLVFTPATVPLLRSEYGKEFDFDAPVKLLDKMMHAMAQSPGQQVIILSQVLAAEANVGYEDVVNTQVLAVDGQAVHSLKELVALVEGGPPREIIRFDLEYQQAIALDRAQVAAATADILRQHCIPADRSVDLLGGS